MATCFSSPKNLATPCVFVLSKIPRLAEHLKTFALPGVQLKNVLITDSEIDEEQISLIKEAEIAVCDADLLGKFYKNMPNLKWAHSTFAGVEPLFKLIPEKPSFIISRHAGEPFCVLIAEYVVCQILNCERLSKLCWKSQESKTWLNSESFTYRTLDQITVAILGVGNMGSAIAKFLKSRGTTVLGFARNPRPINCDKVFDKITNNLEDILKECDYLCNTLPSTPLTCGILNSSILKNCKKNPILINVGRSSVISESDLVQALRNGTFSGAVLDVFEEEPLPASSQLWELPQVTITPHVAAISKPDHVAEEFFNIFSHYVDGHGLPNVVNWSLGY